MNSNSHSHFNPIQPNPPTGTAIQPAGQSPDDDILAAALAYRQAGFSLIPVFRRYKVPAGYLLPQVPDPNRAGGSRGTWKPFQKRPPSEAQIRNWFGPEAPSPCNIALICGAVSGGLVVLDFDEDAPAHFAAWAEQVGSLVRRLAIARSGRGFHVYFRCARPGRNRVLAASATGRIFIEARAGGGLVTAPPSLHRSGARYRWCQGNHMTVPLLTQPAVDCLLAAADRQDERPPKRHSAAISLRANRPVVALDEAKGRRLRAYATAVLKNACLELAAAQGNRNSTLNAVAFRLGSYAATELIRQAEIETALLSACGSDGNQLIDDDGEAAFWATLRSGYEAGLLNPQDLQALWWRLTQGESDQSKPGGAAEA
ncbi:MAG: bifunctional DNA primase/polymerase [Anaerolineales bacterium]|nr:bifunctional DNA primase/polymerase [Anaerolineales bacterium]